MYRKLRSQLSGLIVLLLVAQLFAVVPQVFAATVSTTISTLNAAGDAVVDSTYPTSNFDTKTGSSTGLFSITTSATKEMDGLFKFVVDPAITANPDYGKYKFYISINGKMGSSNKAVTLSVCAAGTTAGSAADWDEKAITWNQAVSLNLTASSATGVMCKNNNNTTTPTLTINNLNTSSPQPYQANVTDYVKAYLADNKNVITFIVGDKSKSSTGVNIYSKESTTAPQLIVQTEVADNNPPYWNPGDSLKVFNLGTDFIQLNWPHARDDESYVKSYNIYKDGVKIANVNAAKSPGKDQSGSALPAFNNYKLTGLTPGATYQLKVEAVDAADFVTGSNSLTASRTTLLSPVESIPLELDSVTASGDDGNVATNTLDDNLNSRWSSSNDPWIQYDLGEVISVGYVGIAFYNGDTRASNLDIDLSADGTTWNRVFSGYSVMMLDMQPFTFPKQDARYVKITGHGNTTNAFTSFTEVKIYPPFPTGDTPVAVVPNIPPGRPPGAVDFTQPGMTNADGTPHAVHTPNTVTGVTYDVTKAPFFADNTGATDAASAIRAAIQGAKPGDEIYLPNGTYKLSSAPDGLTNLTLKSKVNLRGQSQDGTILVTTLDGVKNSSVLKVPNQNNLVISNLTITSTWDDGGGSRYPTSSNVNNPNFGGPENGITVQSGGNNSTSYNVTIDHVTIEKYYRMGIRIDSSHDIVVRNSTFKNTTDIGPSGAGYGVTIQGIAKQDMLGYENDTLWNLVENSYFGSPVNNEVRMRHGVLIQNYAHNNVVRFNTFNNTALDSIDLHGEFEYLNDVYANVISNVAGGGLGLGNTGGAAPSNHGPTGPGNYIHDNTLINTRDGINVTMGTPDTIIENNTIKDTTMAGATGIKILNATKVKIRNNFILNNSGPGFWGIYLAHDNGDTKVLDPTNPWGTYMAGDPSNVEINQNYLGGNTGAISLQAGSGIKVINNVIFNDNGTKYVKADGVQVDQESWPSSDLKSLSLSAGTLTFDPATTTYAVNVDNTIAAISMTPTAADTGATIKVNGTPTVSGATYGPVNLAVGANTLRIDVTAADGTPKAYTITVNRADVPVVPSSNANLSGLTISSGVLSPAFNANTTAYSVNVDNSVTSFKETPTAADTGATIKVNSTSTASGATYGPVNLAVGANTFRIDVTAADGTLKTYTITVNRADVPVVPPAPSSNANLSGLKVWNGSTQLDLTPGTVTVSTYSYSTSVRPSVSSIVVQAASEHNKAVVKINGTVQTADAGVTINSLQYGDNQITIEITAEDGVTKTSYQVNVNRKRPDTDSTIPNSPSGSGGGVPALPSSTESGKNTNTVTAEVKTIDGKKVTHAKVDDQVIDNALKKSEGGKLTFGIDSGTGVAQTTVTITNTALQKIASNDKVKSVSVDTSIGRYELPVKQMDAQAWAAKLGTPKDQVYLEITMVRNEAAASQAKASGRTSLAAVEFTVRAVTAGGKSVEVATFTQYVPRSIKSEAVLDAGHLAAVRVETDNAGKPLYEPVPYTVSGTEATLYSRTNSTYMLLNNNMTFSDIRKHWAQDDIERMANRMIVQGASETEFRPNQAVSRAEFAALVTRALGLSAQTSAKNAFKDVQSSDWFAGQVYVAAEAGIITGFDDQTFRPGQPISRQEMAVMIYRAMKFAGFDGVSGGTNVKFADENRFQDWVKEAIGVMASKSIVQGVASGEFDPAGTATRAQSAAILSRMLGSLQFTQ
ncbi:cadherin-like beta sandwich domain-containing protein [Paenibacillus filicis]|uniref:Cadherin-like beta sandwich domain-containing protein n=1 Tax=Paenibacillus gyeongsangnamensis TaxID=3388067 RepID=A0ABT4Q9H1_9BACL|nr:cadherin-like beta sandwich domain-containing protein [Paenibacillus filicis]MCZ8513522.1 cadherin-like beta sandwich domain-containing protein [Paenibacillus filicis]